VLDGWLFGGGFVLLVAGLALLLASRRRRVLDAVLVRPGEVACLRVPDAAARLDGIRVEARLRVAPGEGYRLFARLTGEDFGLPPVVQLDDRPGAPLGALDREPGPARELRVVLGTVDARPHAGAELRVELSPVPPTRLEGGVIELVRTA
jgi:hypothetical protein